MKELEIIPIEYGKSVLKIELLPYHKLGTHS